MGIVARSLVKIVGFSGSSNSVHCFSRRVSGAKRNRTERYEQRWRSLFADPSQWWDNRLGKPNSRFPDFKQKQTGAGLWLIDGRNPPWVASEVASLEPGVSVLSRAQKLAGYNKAGQYLKTLQHFKRMRRDGGIVDSYVFVHALNACAALKVLEDGKLIHRQIIETGCRLNLHLSSGLVDMYAKCGSIDSAFRVFSDMPRRDVVSWTAMILGCVKCGENLKALELFEQMQQEGFDPDGFTFVALVNACASIGAIEKGRRVHEQIIQAGFETDIYVGSSLVDMYAKCGSIHEAWRIFNKMPSRDLVTWNAMIRGCVKCGQEQKALQLFQQMQRTGVTPDCITFVALLNACASTLALEEGRRIHEQLIWNGFESDVYTGTSLVDMYSKCGSLDEAWGAFNKMPARTVVAWTAMILGFVKCGEGLNALQVFDQMQEEGLEPDSRTFVGVLNACAILAALEVGRRVHKQIVKSGLEDDAYVASSLVDMYSKCGSIVDAWRVFSSMPTCDVVGWTAMIMGYAMHGQAKEAVALFEQMFRAGSEINEVTFVCLLSACSHGGLVKEGLQYFESMWSVYGVSPIQEHYTCMVDMLGRAGRLDDAEAIVNTMPLEPCAATWMALLGACRTHGNVKMAELASKRILELDDKNSSGYVLLSNIYAASGHYESKVMVHEQRLRKGAMKQPGRTWIELNNEVHSFVVNDTQHPQILQIREELARLSARMKDAGYIPDPRFDLHDVEEEKRVGHLCGHSEKLAIAFGLINTPAGTPLRIVKNLRVCGDCHTATKFISKITHREITFRDANRFHLFKDGICSCGEY